MTLDVLGCIGKTGPENRILELVRLLASLNKRADRLGQSWVALSHQGLRLIKLRKKVPDCIVDAILPGLNRT